MQRLALSEITLRLATIILMIFHFDKISSFDSYKFFAVNDKTANISFMCTLMMLIFLAIGLWRLQRRYFLSAFIFSHFSFYMFAYGGDSYAYLTLLFISLVSLKKDVKLDLISSLGLNTLQAFLAAIYLFNAHAKLSDPVWMNGEAMIYLFNTKYVESSSVMGQVLSYNGHLFSYGVILAQLSIVLIFFKKVRKSICWIFIMKHLFIAIFMLPYFGLFGIILHLIILSSDDKVRVHILRELQRSYLAFKTRK